MSRRPVALFLFCCITLIFSIWGTEALPSSYQVITKGSYVRPEHIDIDVWESASRFFLPYDHPMREQLDKIFMQKKRVSLTPETLAAAGFKHTTPGKWSKVVVTSHNKLKGYLVKIYTDNVTGVVDWAKFINRVRGADNIREAISRHGWQSIFKVPNKWIYPLPSEPSPPAGYERKNFLLLVEDMKILSNKKSLNKWKSNSLSKSKLDIIYLMLKEEGLRDTVYAFNMPFAKDGKIAFIDTEYYHQWPVHYRLLLQYLSKDNQKYWKTIANIN